jgi:hypothetical protein
LLRKLTSACGAALRTGALAFKAMAALFAAWFATLLLGGKDLPAVLGTTVVGA